MKHLYRAMGVLASVSVLAGCGGGDGPETASVNAAKPSASTATAALATPEAIAEATLSEYPNDFHKSSAFDLETCIADSDHPGSVGDCWDRDSQIEAVLNFERGARGGFTDAEWECVVSAVQNKPVEVVDEIVRKTLAGEEIDPFNGKLLHLVTPDDCPM